MVAQSDIEHLQARVHELRGAIWRDRRTTLERIHAVRREARELMRRGGAPGDIAALQSLMRLTDCLQQGFARPA